MARLDAETRLLLMRFACAMAWADLSIQPEEREHILGLMDRLEIERPEDRKEVIRWLKSPPPPDVIDPSSIPRAARQLFVEECERVVRADGVVKPDEAEVLDLLRRILFGEREGTGRGAMASKEQIVEQLNKILQLELAGVSRYLHYSFLVFGPNRIPIVSFFREQANEGIQHAIVVGEKITSFGGHPTIVVETPPEPARHDVRSLLQESLDFERKGLAEYVALLGMVGGDVALEELTRGQIRAETEHCEEVEKMLREAVK